MTAGNIISARVSWFRNLKHAVYGMTGPAKSAFGARGADARIRELSGRTGNYTYTAAGERLSANRFAIYPIRELTGSGGLSARYLRPIGNAPVFRARKWRTAGMCQGVATV